MDQENIGGARPALAAHSKDAAVQGQTPSSHTKASPPAQDGPAQAGTMRDAAQHAAETIGAEASHAVERGSQYVREQPFAAVALVGVLSLGLGILLGRRAGW